MAEKTGCFWRIILSTLILFTLSVAFQIMSYREGLTAHGWLLISMLLITLVLSYPVIRSRGSGLILSLATFLVFFGIFTFNTFNEALFFKINVTAREAFIGMSKGFLLALVFSPVLVAIMGKMTGKTKDPETPVAPRMTMMKIIWKTIASAFAYCVLYFAAGIIVSPFIMEFYKQFEPLPAPGQIALMQIFRGIIYVAVTVPILQMMGTTRLKTAITAGFLLSILGGIAPLLVPNPLMPPNIRLAHGIEVGISNFIYGFIIGYLFVSKDSAEESRNAG